MGRWAQRSRRGGGPGTRPPATITITVVSIDDPDGSLQVLFSDDVDVVNFTTADFLVDTGSEFVPAAGLSQGGSNQLTWFNFSEWPGLHFGQAWQYIGTAPGVVSPQSGNVS